MAKRVSSTDAKAHFSELMAGVEFQGERVIIERRGRPVAALVSVKDLRQLEKSPRVDEPSGALALVGTWADILSDKQIDEMVEHIYSERERDLGRPVDLGG